MADPVIRDATADFTSAFGIDPEMEKPGFLLKKDKPKAVAERAFKIWSDKDEMMNRKEAVWGVNSLRRKGVANVELRQETDDQSWIAYVPPHIKRRPEAVQVVNKAKANCRRLASLMFTDPPAPEAQPRTGDDEDRDTAEFATRVLTDLQHDNKLADVRAHQEAFDRASTFQSGFIHYRVDPRAGGRAKLQISAGVGAQTVGDALDDPETGMEWQDYVERFVRPDGSLTNDASEAAEQFLPGLKREVLDGRNVRPIPWNAADVWECDGIQLGTFMSWGKIKKTWPEEAKKVQDDEMSEIFRWRPKRWKNLVSPHDRRVIENKASGKIKDEWMAFVLTTYYKESPDYPRGACVITIGKHLVVEQREWVEEDDQGNTISLPIPVTQHKQWNDGERDFYGTGLMDDIGAGNEIRAFLVAKLMDWTDRAINRKIFVDTTSNIRPEQLRLPGHAVIPKLPGGKVEYETVPAFPSDGINLYNITGDEMDSISLMPNVAQGLESPQVQSGRHAQVIISQVHAALAEPRFNVIRAYLYACLIQLSLVRAFFDSPRTIGWVGEDGAYKEKRWRGNDLRGVGEIELRQGSLSMLSPVAKATLAEHQFQMGVITQQELKEVTISNLGSTLGIQDDPFLTRIRGQLSAWEDGPPDGWQPQIVEQPLMQPVLDPATGQQIGEEPAIDPQTGQPQLQPVQVPDQVLGKMFFPVPADEQPDVALTRARELAKLMSRDVFMSHPPEWQWGVINEYMRATGQSQGAQGPPIGAPPPPPLSPAQVGERQGPLAPPQTPLPSETGLSQVT